MCGIFGVLSTKDRLTLDQERFIADGTVVGQLRGDDGTGLVTVDSKGSYDVYKRALPGADFFFTRLGTAAKRSIANAKLVVGHNRKGTSGGNTNACCHPFPYENVTGVHNGTIPWATLNRIKSIGDDTLVDVDSAKVYAAINASDDPIKVLEQINPGSYALVWINHKDNTINFARNSDRPMWLANGSDGLYFASEAGMLYWLMSRHTLEADDSMMYQLDQNTLYTFNIDNYLEVKKTTYKSSPPKYSGAHGTNYSGGGYNNHVRSTTLYPTAALEPVRTFRTISTMRLELPGMGEVADILSDNVDEIAAADSSVPKWANYVDVDLLMAVRPERNETRPDVWGVLHDTTDSGILIPIRIAALDDKEWDVLSRIPEGDSAEGHSYPTMRVEVNTIRVFASGDVLLGCSPKTIWDTDSDIPDGTYTQEAIGEIVNIWAERDRKYTADQLTAMWASLTKKQ